ncbi:MAG: hypothetical protein LC803_04820 [Acidobacteria bacterium]|nr:hypothetical protein [Acidobacteriota bacterium]
MRVTIPARNFKGLATGWQGRRIAVENFNGAVNKANRAGRARGEIHTLDKFPGNPRGYFITKLKSEEMPPNSVKLLD